MKAVVVLALVALLLGGAWLVRSRFRPAPPRITVTSEPAAVAAARARWESERERKLAELLADPASFHPDFAEQAVLVASDRPRVVAELTQAREGESETAERRVAAGIALLRLGEPGSLDQLVGVAGEDLRAREMLLDSLDDLLPEGERIPGAVHQLLLPALEDPGRGPRLALVAARRRMQEAEETISRLALQRPPDGDPWLEAAAILRPTQELVQRARERLHDAALLGPPPGLPALVQAAVSTSDPDLREVALGAALEHLRAQDDAPWIDGATVGAVMALAQLPPASASASLADLALNAKWTSLRRMALDSLRGVDAARAAAVAREAGPSLGDGSGVGPASGRARVTGRQAAEIAVRHGLLDAAAADAALTAMSARLSADELADDAFGFLTAARLATSFDVETGTSPNRHDLLVLELAALAGDRFRPEAVLETYELASEDAESGTYSVRFIHGDRLYEFAPEDLGDWYDLEAVLAALDRALQDAGLRERYVMLEPDGQVAEVAFGDPSKVRAAAPELGLALADGATGAMRAGQEAEKRMLDALRGSD